MSVPMLDALNSECVGVLEDDECKMIVIMHDHSVEAVGGGEMFRESFPLCIETTGPVCVDRKITVDQGERKQLSDGFINEANKVYEAINGIESHEIKFEKCESDIEQSFLTGLVNCYNADMELSEARHSILQNAHHKATGHKDSLTDISFLDADLSNQDYLRNKSIIDEWGLYISHLPEYESLMLWLRTKVGESVKEVPLVCSVKGGPLLLSKNPSFSDGLMEPASEGLKVSLENENNEHISTTVEQKVYELVQQCNLTDSTLAFIANATDSSKIN